MLDGGEAQALFGSVFAWRSADGARWGWWTAHPAVGCGVPNVSVDLMRCKGATADCRWIVDVNVQSEQGREGMGGVRRRTLSRTGHRNGVEAVRWAETFVSRMVDEDAARRRALVEAVRTRGIWALPG